MTESELVESAALYYSLTGDMMNLYLTVTSGFLIVAYLAGRKLTKSQLIIVSCLYLIFASLATYLTIGYGLRGIAYATELAVVNPDTQVYANPAVPVILASVYISGILASLKFMWDVRQPRTV